MRKHVLYLVARQLWIDALRSKVLLIASVLLGLLLLFAIYTGWLNYHDQNHTRELVQEEVRQSWESNPDKHPHRMAHYGSFALRLKHPLSLFDFGLENFVGNAVFLEAHKQNTVNFSEAGMSTGLLRFGEVSMAMILKVILPLLIFYIGFSSIAREREKGTLKLLIGQGISRKEILFGKWFGLWSLSLIPLIIIFAILFTSVILGNHEGILSDSLWRYLILLLTYLQFFGIISALAIMVSAYSKTSKAALVKLLGVWLLFVIILPKSLQALGYYLFPTPSKIELETFVEHDLKKIGDSHNPDDPHFNALRDSLLFVHQVDRVEDLPFNYSGFVMAEGEALSTKVYLKHQEDLYEVYEQQNDLERWSAFVNPYSAIKNLSMALSGSDFKSFLHFKDQAEAYRYHLAQEMNRLQMEMIPNSGQEGPLQISNKYWKEFPPFEYQFLQIRQVLRNEMISVLALLLWNILVVLFMSKKASGLKAI